MNSYPHTLISVPLNNLRPFDMDPRITRNPRYDEIRESIRNRGLDHPPQITQRPGDDYYIIANGGNTRLAILNELWLETHNKKYQEVTCLFCPWPDTHSREQGDLHCLLGHLVENEQRGSLSWIEQALAVRKAAEMCQGIFGSLSQTELLQKLSQDGYSIHQSVYSKMMATINLLLPHIPELLYEGLPKLAAEKLLALHSCTSKLWETYYQQMSAETRQSLPDFEDIFALALSPFSQSLSIFSLEHVRDELTGLVSQTLKVDYNIVALTTDPEACKRQTLLGAPKPVLPEVSAQRHWQPDTKIPQISQIPDTGGNRKETVASESDIDPETDNSPGVIRGNQQDPPTPEAEQAHPENRADEIWDINPVYDDPTSLASLAEQIAWELAEIAGLEHLICPSAETGFQLMPSEMPLSNETRLYWQILAFIASEKDKKDSPAVFWQQMIMGTSDHSGLPDKSIIKVLQLIRVIRRLHEKQREVNI